MMSNADADVAPANVRVLVRVRPLSDVEKSGGGRNGAGNGSSILSLGGTATGPMDFGQGGGTAGGSATITVNDGGLGGAGAGGGGYGSGYESDYSGKTYHFDAVHGPRSTQADVFGSVRGIVDAVAAG